MQVPQDIGTMVMVSRTSTTAGLTIIIKQIISVATTMQDTDSRAI